MSVAEHRKQQNERHEPIGLFGSCAGCGDDRVEECSALECSALECIGFVCSWPGSWGSPLAINSISFISVAMPAEERGMV